MTQQKKPFVIIITGPTVSGKTGFSYDLARQISGEIINADSGQFYTPLKVGTAKPDWQNHQTPAHLFDILDKPIDVTVFEYKERVTKLIEDIRKRNNIPIIVGGSLFYIKSLLFPPKKALRLHNPKRIQELVLSLPQTHLWDYLQTIDPLRASKIHPNDTYRLHRALTIWLATGEKPSLKEPEFNPDFDFLLICLTPSKEILAQRIEERTYEMLKEGWLKEAEKCINSPWESFVQSKGFIGYKELIAFLQHKSSLPLESVTAKIIQQTKAYAKRQKTFLTSLIKQLENLNKQHLEAFSYTCLSNATDEDISKIAELVRKQQQNILVGKM